VALVATGCAGFDSETSQVAPSPFAESTATSRQTRASFAPAATETAARVDTLGRKIIAANPQTGIKPLFRTVGVPEPEVFHRGTAEVDITEGLVRKCPNDGQLAAVLCLELGKMIAEREASAGAKARLPEAEPPMEVRIGNDGGTVMGSADQTRLAELGKFEKTHPRAAPRGSIPAPEPTELGRLYLTKAGYSEQDMTAAMGLWQASSTTGTLERQFNALPSPAGSWIR
jgi:hypothetical protein